MQTDVQIAQSAHIKHIKHINQIAEKIRAEGLVNPIITEDVLDETDGEMPEEE